MKEIEALEKQINKLIKAENNLKLACAYQGIENYKLKEALEKIKEIIEIPVQNKGFECLDMMADLETILKIIKTNKKGCYLPFFEVG